MEQMGLICTKGGVLSVSKGLRGSDTGGLPRAEVIRPPQNRRGRETERISIMAKRKRKLTAVENDEKKRRQKEYMTIFINGKQKRVKRPPTIDGMDVDEFIRKNGDPIWLHQNEMWEYMTDDEES
jgi:hypothetical protein